MVCLLREKNQLEQVQICSQLEIILTFSRKCLFYRIFTLPNFTLSVTHQAEWYVKVKCTLRQCCDMNGKDNLNKNATYIIQH